MNRGVVIAMLVGAMAAAESATAQTVRFLKFTPDVLVPDQTVPVSMEVETTGGVPSQVTLEPGNGSAITTTIPLRDDGTGGDRVAGDRIVPGTTGKDVALTITTKDGSGSTAGRPIIALTLIAGGWWMRGRRRTGRRWAFAAALAIAVAACGGNSTPPMSTPTPTPTPTTTPPGTYAIAVVGTSGVLQRSATVTLAVQ